MAFYSNKYDGRQLRLEVWQGGEYLYWQLFSEGGSTNYYTIFNCDIRINGVQVYAPGTVLWSSYNFPAAKGNTSGSVYIGPSASGRNISVSFTGTVFNNKWDNYGGSVYMSPTIYAPVLNNVGVSNIGDKSVYAAFSVGNANGQNPYSPYIDVATGNFSGIVTTINARAGTLSGLTPNRTYYVRGNDANDAGRSYTNVVSFKTLFYNPGTPGKPTITYNTNEPIPTSIFTIKWNAATAGSTAIAGYRLRIFKNNVQVFNEDTESTSTTKTFNAIDLGLVPGDIIRVGIYAYCKDWEGTKFFNGGGSGEGQVFSDYITIISDKFVKVSVNGSEFTKYKMYIITSGGVIEVKKEKLKVL